MFYHNEHNALVNTTPCHGQSHSKLHFYPSPSYTDLPLPIKFAPTLGYLIYCLSQEHCWSQHNCNTFNGAFHFYPKSFFPFTEISVIAWLTAWVTKPAMPLASNKYLHSIRKTSSNPGVFTWLLPNNMKKKKKLIFSKEKSPNKKCWGFLCWLTWDLIMWRILMKRRKNIMVHNGANVQVFIVYPISFLGLY